MAEREEYTFGHIHVYCTDLEKTERWFVDGIGAEFVTKRDSRGTPGVELRLGGQQILLRGARDGENHGIGRRRATLGPTTSGST